MTRAQEAEVMFSVKRELSQLREQNKELYRSLSASEEQIIELKSKNQVEIIYWPVKQTFVEPTSFFLGLPCACLSPFTAQFTLIFQYLGVIYLVIILLSHLILHFLYKSL